MTDAVKIALITASGVGVPSLVTQLLLFLSNRKKLITVEQNTNNKLDQLLKQRDEATTRADRAEGHAQGITAEQDRTKP